MPAERSSNWNRAVTYNTHTRRHAETKICSYQYLIMALLLGCCILGGLCMCQAGIPAPWQTAAAVFIVHESFAGVSARNVYRSYVISPVSRLGP